MKKIIILYFMFLTSILQADEIFLTDGNALKGRVLNVSTDLIEYNTEQGTSEKINRSTVLKIVYESGKEINFYDRIFMKDGSVISGKVIRSNEAYIEYKPSGNIPYDKIERVNAARIVYDNGKVEVLQKTEETDIVYLKNGKTFKANNIAVNANNIDFFDETNKRMFYGKNMVLKIVYKNGTVYTPEMTRSETSKTPYTGNCFLELEMGWNGYTGLGPRVDYRLFNGFSINGGAGLYLQGVRVSGALRYYLEYPYGLAFSLGAALNSGMKSTQHDYETENSYGIVIKEDVEMDYKPVTTINASILYFWRLYAHNRIYVETGYAYAIQKTKYTYTTRSGYRLTKDSTEIEDIIAPGGVIISVGYAFAF